MPGPLPAGSLPTAGDTQVIRRTTTQPVRSIKASGRGRLLPFPRPHVARQLAEPRGTSVVRSGGCQAPGNGEPLHLLVHVLVDEARHHQPRVPGSLCAGAGAHSGVPGLL